MTQSTVGRYEIRAELGKGGIGTVYRAYDPLLKREVALKVLEAQLFATNPELANRFEQEAETIASLEHHSIIPLYDFGKSGEWRYFVRRLMKGGTLGERIASGPLMLEQAAEIVGRVGSALERAHQQGIIHRDLKPTNILFDEGGDAYLSDFGFIKTENLRETQESVVQIFGTPAYMSPEQLDGRAVDKRSDIYSLGVILYEMLAGKKPFDHQSAARLIVMHLTQPAPSILKAVPSLPTAVDMIFQKAMAKEPENRYSTVEELVYALEEAVWPSASVGNRSAGLVAHVEEKLTSDETPLSSQQQETAVALTEAGKHGEAADVYRQAGDLEQAARHYELAERWSDAAEMWFQLDRYDQRAEACEQYAQWISKQAVGGEEKAIAWERAASAYSEIGEQEAQLMSEREVARYRREPILILEIEPGEMQVDVWTTVKYKVRNEGFGSARTIYVGLVEDQFEGRKTRTLTTRTLVPGTEFTHWLEVYPREQGTRVPMQLMIEYKDKNEQMHRSHRTFHLAVEGKTPTAAPPLEEESPPGVEVDERLNRGQLLALRDRIAQFFNESELHDICLELGIDPETFDDSKNTFIRELIFYLSRRGRLEELIVICRRVRPRVEW